MKVFVILRDDETESISSICGVFLNQEDAQSQLYYLIRTEFSIEEDIGDFDLRNEIRYSGINYCIEEHLVQE